MNRAFLALFLLLGCQTTGLVERRAGNATSYGRSVPGEAYAWYVRGQYHERGGELGDAAYAYEQALKQDDRSGSAWGALLRVYCRKDEKAAWETLERGRARALEQLPLLVAASHCASEHGKKSEAIVYARAALALDPHSEIASRTIVSALRGAGDSGTADAAERAFKLFRGYTLARTPELAQDHVFSSVKEARARADQAILEGNIEGARRDSVGTLGDGELALRAALLGQVELAHVLAEHVLFLDPDDGEAALAWAFTLALEPASGEGLRSRGDPGLKALLRRPQSPLLLCAYAAWVRGRVTEDDFRAIPNSGLCRENADDPIQTQLARRLKAESAIAPVGTAPISVAVRDAPLTD
jgi:tetratricopeptide (TPR) repeat protein